MSLFKEICELRECKIREMYFELQIENKNLKATNVIFLKEFEVLKDELEALKIDNKTLRGEKGSNILLVIANNDLAKENERLKEGWEVADSYWKAYSKKIERLQAENEALKEQKGATKDTLDEVIKLQEGFNYDQPSLNDTSEALHKVVLDSKESTNNCGLKTRLNTIKNFV